MFRLRNIIYLTLTLPCLDVLFSYESDTLFHNSWLSELIVASLYNNTFILNKSRFSPYLLHVYTLQSY